MSNLILYQALVVFVYSIALADGSLQPEEKSAFLVLMEKEFKNGSWWAINRFKLLESQERMNIEQCHRFALLSFAPIEVTLRKK